MALDLSFLAQIRYSQMTLEFAVEQTIRVPGFAGSSFRGALGHVFRGALCSRRPACGSECATPEECAYYSLFERSRDLGGRFSRNSPKAMILEPLVPAGLDGIAHGAAPGFPYQVLPPVYTGAAPQLLNDNVVEIPPGCSVPLLVTFLGPVTALALVAIEALAAQPFPAMGGRLRLIRVLDATTAGRVIFDEDLPHYAVQPPAVRTLDGGPERPFSGRMRVVLTTPTRLVRDRMGRETCVRPAEMAASFLQHCLVRAIKIHDAFGPPGRTRLPWMDLPEAAPQPVGHRLYHYRLPRVSHRQQAWMDFDGLLGYFDLHGDWSADLIRLLRAAEILHVAEKATSGLGRVRCFDLTDGSWEV